MAFDGLCSAKNNPNLLTYTLSSDQCPMSRDLNSSPDSMVVVTGRDFPIFSPHSLDAVQQWDSRHITCPT